MSDTDYQSEGLVLLGYSQLIVPNKYVKKWMKTC